jgi:Bacterial Ig-like domain (group 2)
MKKRGGEGFRDPASLAHRRLVRQARRRCAGLLTVGLGAGLLAACSSQPTALPPVSSPKQLHVEFTSDQGVILPHQGATYQLKAEVLTSAGHVVDEPVTWRSTAPHAVAVSSSGRVKALVSTGSSNIVATAEHASASNAQVVVAKVGPKSVVVPSTTVVARSAHSVTLRTDEATDKLAVGDILLSGSRAGLLTKVTSLRAVGHHLVVHTRRASLAQAFTHLVQHAQTPPVHALLSSGGGGVGLDAFYRGLGTAGRSEPVLAKVGTCTGTTTTPTSAGHSLSVKLVGPSISVPVTVRLVADLKITFFSVKRFELAVEAKIPVKVTTGSVTVSAAGTASISCKLTIPSLSIPTPLWLAGIIEIEGTIAPTVKINATVKASGQVTVTGPVFTDTANALDGVDWTKGKGWSPVDSNQQSGLKMTPASASYKASLSAAVEPQFRLDAGVKAHLGPCGGTTCTLAGINLAFVQVAGKLAFGLTSPLSSLAAGYAGPHWGATVTLQAGPELQLTGDLTKILKWIGIKPPGGQLALFTRTIPIASSPKLILDASRSGTAVTLKLSVPNGYDGDNVKFVAIPKGATKGSVIATATVTATAVASSWTLPRSSWTGEVVAELFDRIFGAVGLPYASPETKLSTRVPPTPTTATTLSPTSPPSSTIGAPTPEGLGAEVVQDLSGTNYHSVCPLFWPELIECTSSGFIAFFFGTGITLTNISLGNVVAKGRRAILVFEGKECLSAGLCQTNTNPDDGLSNGSFSANWIAAHKPSNTPFVDPAVEVDGRWFLDTTQS